MRVTNEELQAIKRDVIDAERLRCVLEPGRGLTYDKPDPTLYGIGTYPRSSVLAGQERRVWLMSWDVEHFPTPDAAWAEAERALRDAGIRYTKRAGSTFTPPALNHLPDGED